MKRIGAYFFVLFMGFQYACAPSKMPPAQHDEVIQETVRLTADASASVLTIGDVFRYTIRVAHRVPVPLFDLAFDNEQFEQVDSGKSTPEKNGEHIVYQQWYTLRAKEIGSYVLPKARVQFKENGGQQSIESNEVWIEVKSVLPANGEAEDIRDIKTLAAPRMHIPMWAWFILGFFILVLAALLGRKYWQKKNKKTEIQREAHEIALEALKRIRNWPLDDPIFLKKFYFEISEIIRAYLEARFFINATDMTTYELDTMIARVQEITSEQRFDLRRFFDRTDEVKFADHHPSEQDAESIYQQAMKFIEIFRPKMPIPDTTQKR